jgi:protein TonB
VFVPCDKEPQVDNKRLAKLLIYPVEALENDIEGKVVIRVLIDIDGSIKKYYIDRSSNDIFNISAINAIKEYGKFIPAINKGKPLVCWISCPIAFSIKR